MVLTGLMEVLLLVQMESSMELLPVEQAAMELYSK